MSGRAGNIRIEPAANRDGSITWIAHGIAGGIPYVVEGDSEADASAAAAAVVFESHGRRRLEALLARDRTNPMPCAIMTGDRPCQP